MWRVLEGKIIILQHHSKKYFRQELTMNFLTNGYLSCSHFGGITKKYFNEQRYLKLLKVELLGHNISY